MAKNNRPDTLGDHAVVCLFVAWIRIHSSYLGDRRAPVSVVDRHSCQTEQAKGRRKQRMCRACSKISEGAGVRVLV